MVREFKLPDVGEGVAEGELLEWHVEPGDTVSEDQVVADVETDKAVVDVPSPVNGTVRELLAEPGDVVPVGEVIITFDVEGEAPEESEGGAAAETGTETDAAGEAGAAPDDAGETAESSVNGKGGRVFAAPSARRLARELGVDITGVDGSGPGGRVTESDVRAAAEGGDSAGSEAGESDDGKQLKSAVSRIDDGDSGGNKSSVGDGLQSAVSRVDDGEGGEPGGAAPESGAAASVEAAGRERTLAAPATRQVAEDLGVDIDDVPTDEVRDGQAFVDEAAVREYAEVQQRAQAADAEALADAADAGEAGATAESAEAGASGADDAATGAVEAAKGDRREPYSGMRRTIGQAMERSKFTAPHVTHHEKVDATALVETREKLKERADERGVKLTYVPFVMKAVVAALDEHPVLNTQLDEDNEEIVFKSDRNVGVAAATEAGLMVPVVESVDEKGLLQLASEVNELVSKARERSIAREEMQGGTFTITNFGAIGGEYATPIINYPETAILGLGAIEERPVAEDGEVVARDVLPLSLSVDHRVVDGADAARFVETLKEYLEDPTLLLLE
ncbi:dihydrolipoamide acetyltransferase family protein [Halosimplex pelagicum]|uniref:2-oxo acid dehydrogenase subunit E2 n=1 Tax=Halosimplex pelagicum TaxID=869886 RepID=A0A7D5P9R9_9EURY|nr:dihydrolipoamide acetyltransferase family protein [Halosimplex pelagicum]QLH80922.1 2-oxo acid dehydrogenase subunit E2 [Halosimplex pelagicum]